jgi:hypothetical protein
MTPPEPVTDGGTVNSVDDGYWRWVLDALSSESQSDRANAQLCYANMPKRHCADCSMSGTDSSLISGR